MKFEDAAVGTRIIERHKDASPKTVIAVEGRCVRVENDAGRETSITEKTLKRYDVARPRLKPVKIVLANEDEEYVLGTFSQGVRFEHYHAMSTGGRTNVMCVASGRKVAQSGHSTGWLTESGVEYAHLYVQAI